MADVRTRRPLPALVFLAALTMLTALVWWRVIHRDGDQASANSSCPTQSTQNVLPRPSTVLVSVLNSTTRTGIAKSAAASLTKDGFKISGYGNDTGHAAIAATAEIRFGPDQHSAATLLGYYFPGAKLVPGESRADGTVVVSLGTAYKAVATAAAVKAAMAADHVTVAPSQSPVTPSGAASC
jgi:hypothetical protein